MLVLVYRPLVPKLRVVLQLIITGKLIEELVYATNIQTVLLLICFGFGILPSLTIKSNSAGDTPM